MTRIAALVAGALLSLAPSAPGAGSVHERLFHELSAETAEVRESARQRLAKSPELTEDEVRTALAAADLRAKPLLLELAAARAMKGLVPEIAAALAAPEPQVTDAAARALVLLGPDAVEAGLAKLGDAKDREAALVRVHLQALAARHAVEREVISRWRRKGGSYEGRYKDLARLGWPVQPVLLAMILDVPLPDHDVVLPEDDDADALRQRRRDALEDIAASNRRGYRTFEPLPVHIEPEELFDLASQALRDVADLDLMGEILERVSEQLQDVDENRWRLRPFEKHFYREIDGVLFARGRPERLLRLAGTLRSEVETETRHIARGRPDKRADALQALSYSLTEYASVLHQLRKYDDAARQFLEVVKIGRELGGKDPAIAGYNRACALAKAGERRLEEGDAEGAQRRREEAIRQLARALDRERSTGSEDLTREWVTEDGDLASLHADPVFQELIRKRFGEPEAAPPGRAGSPLQDAPVPGGSVQPPR